MIKALPKEAMQYYLREDYINDAEEYASKHRKQRIKLLSEMLPMLTHLRTLEVGCGSGVHANDFLHYVGLDLSIKALKRAKSKSHFVCASCTHLPFQSRKFQLVVAFNVIEHLYNPQVFLKESCRVLAPNGYLAIISPELVPKTSKLKRIIYRSYLQLKAYLKLQRLLPARFRATDYSKIGANHDAVYLTDFDAIASYLISSQHAIIINKRHRFLFWLKRFNGLLLARIRKGA